MNDAPLKDCWLWVSPAFSVMDRSTSGTLTKPLDLMSSASMRVTGAGPSTFTRRMREPMTTISSMDSAEVFVAGGPAASCPEAAVKTKGDSAAKASATEPERVVIMWTSRLQGPSKSRFMGCTLRQ
ncbi:MAG: hypothetical protein U1F35_00960 [Steroidobacteraceae bacterium]